jgi:hypothetical protein
LRGHERIALDVLIQKYRNAPGAPVAFTVRQMALLCGVSRMKAQRAISTLADLGFIVLVAKGSYERKRLPSRYRLTMFPCGEIEPTHDYVDDDKEWRRQGRGPKADERPKPTTRLTVFNVPMERAPALAEAIGGVLTAGP